MMIQENDFPGRFIPDLIYKIKIDFSVRSILDINNSNICWLVICNKNELVFCKLPDIVLKPAIGSSFDIECSKRGNKSRIIDFFDCIDKKLLFIRASPLWKDHHWRVVAFNCCLSKIVKLNWVLFILPLTWFSSHIKKRRVRGNFNIKTEKRVW